MFRQLGRCARRLRLRPPLNKWRHSTVVGIALLRKTWPLGLYSNTVPVSLRRAFATQIKLQKGTSASGIPYTDDSVYLHNAIESRTEMRILELNPPDPQDQSKLCGQLVVAKIEDSPDYEALSYTWGEPVFSETLFLPTGRFPITATLATGLRTLRHPDRVRRLWIDAISINQADSLEKGNQVAIMSKIYQNASCVPVWLGEGSKDTEAAISFIHEIVQSENEREKNFPAPLTTARYPLENLACLYAFASQSWFERLWTLQEYVLAPTLMFYNGSKTLSGSDLDIFTLLVLRLLGHPLNARGLYQKTMSMPGFADCLIALFGIIITRLTFWKRHPEETVRQSLAELLDEHGLRKHTNDHDVVYGLLGLVDPEGDIQLDVDYERTIQNLFLHITLHYLETEGLKIIRGAGKHLIESGALRTRNVDGLGFPSWVRDWRQFEHSRSIKGLGDVDVETATNQPPSWSFRFAEDQAPMIGFQGVQLQVVHRVADGLPIDYDVEKPVELYRHFKLQQRTLSAEGSRAMYPNGEDLSIAFVRALTFDGRHTTSYLVLPDGSSPDILVQNWLQFEQRYADESVTNHHYTKLNHSGNHPTAPKNLIVDTVLAKSEPIPASYETVLYHIASHQTFIFTESGYFGFGPLLTEPGDVVVLLDGGQNPFILRRVDDTYELDEETKKLDPCVVEDGEGYTWELIGQCYLYGFMDNETCKSEYEHKRQTFYLV